MISDRAELNFEEVETPPLSQKIVNSQDPGPKKLEKKRVILNQIKAIVKRDLKLNIRSVRFLVVFVMLEFLIPFIFSRIPSFRGR